MKQTKVHFIAVGGSAMHNLALALYNKGFLVSGSDDEIFEPSRTRLAHAGILPEKFGWFPDKINQDLDAVILGMHAREDNPELVRARELGLKIYSYPEYLYEQGKSKTRIVIGGSHGKTTITSMVMHVFKKAGLDFDYMVGSQLDGFDTMVSFSETSRFMILEGDEYLSSPIDRRPKFHHYKPHMALLSGIAWDHINVFPTFDIYVDQFRIFASQIERQGSLVWFSEDPNLRTISSKLRTDIKSIAYSAHKHEIENGITKLNTPYGKTELSVFGLHNLQNISGALEICRLAGISDHVFYEAIASFKGAARRLQLIEKNETTSVYLDFAHSPSKLMATVKAVKAQFPGRKLVACMELHTFSSLKADFLPQYKDTMNYADVAVVYYNPHTVEHKKLAKISPDQVYEAFNRQDLQVFTNSSDLQNHILSGHYANTTILFMTSGNFDGINFKMFANQLLERS